MHHFFIRVTMVAMKKESAAAVIYDDSNKKVLILQRRDVPIWVFPGGGIDAGESPEEAIVREVFEETGCMVSIIRKAGIYHPINKLGTTTHLFLCKIKEGIPVTGTETRDVGFFLPEAFPRDFFYIHKDFLKDAEENPLHIFEKPLSQVTYFALFCYCLKHPIKLFRFLLSQAGFPLNNMD